MRTGFGRKFLAGAAACAAATLTLIAVAVSRGDGPPAGRGEEPRARAPEASDEAPERDEAPGGASELAANVRDSDLVAEVTLARAVSHTPHPLRIIVTDYVFTVNEVIKGDPKTRQVTVRNEGGELPDNTGMETDRSVKLMTGGRYIVFARRVDGIYWLQRVYQVARGGAVVGDADGHAVVGLRSGAFVTTQRRVLKPLRYRIPVAAESPRFEGPPDQGSHPVETTAPEATDGAKPLPLDAVKKAVRAAAKGEEIPEKRPERGDTSRYTGPSEDTEITVRSVTDGGYVSESSNFYTLLPNDNQWAWFQDCEVNWNRLVGDSSSGRNWLFGYMNQNNVPIRNEAPRANNSRFNCGVTTNAQMTNGGYQTWDTLSANGVCYRWYTTTNGRIKEADVLVNASIGADEAQFRKSLTHELGHALTLGHEDRFMAIMYPGTWRQPPNYGSVWYSRTDDFFGARSMLRWVDANIASDRWNIVAFTDSATWSQAHANPGTSGNLVMTSLSTTTVNRGDRVTFRNVHVENRGTTVASNLTLKFYLSWNPIISNIDTEIASYTWSTFNPESYWSGNLDATVPRSMSTGTYYVGWVLTTPTSEISTGNNTTILRRDSAANFAEQTVVVR